MGSFGGHILPGSFFIIFGAWWTIQTAKYRSQRASNKRPSHFNRNIRTIYPSSCFGRNVPAEPILKVVFTFIGICVEFSSAAVEGGHFTTAVSNFQHIVMYSMFLLNGISEILVGYRILVPKGADYFTGALAFLIEAVLFLTHIEHQTPFEKQVHNLLILVIMLCCLSSVVEGWIPERISFKYIRAFFVILQGTWFWQIGFLIYNPIPGQPQVWHSSVPHHDNMWLSVIFSWHCIFILVFQLVATYFAWYLNHGCSFTVNVHNAINSSCADMPLIEQKGTSSIYIEDDNEECLFPGND